MRLDTGEISKYIENRSARAGYVCFFFLNTIFSVSYLYIIDINDHVDLLDVPTDDEYAAPFLTSAQRVQCMYPFFFSTPCFLLLCMPFVISYLLTTIAICWMSHNHQWNMPRSVYVTFFFSTPMSYYRSHILQCNAILFPTFFCAFLLFPHIITHTCLFTAIEFRTYQQTQTGGCGLSQHL